MQNPAETSSRTEPIALTIFIDSNKSIDDVVRIARVEGRKKIKCDVKVIDIARLSAEKFLAWVLPKYQSLNVGARSGMETE